MAQVSGKTQHSVLYIEDNPANLKMVKKILGTRLTRIGSSTRHAGVSSTLNTSTAARYDVKMVGLATNHATEGDQRRVFAGLRHGLQGQGISSAPGTVTN